MGRGYFGVAVYHPKRDTNVGTLWRSATAYGGAFMATVGRRYSGHQASDTCKSPVHTPLYHYESIDDLIDHLPRGCPLIGVELDERAVPLPMFHHPMQALYLLGAEDYGLPEAVRRRCHFLLQVPSAVTWSLNVGVAGSIVMAHRFMRREWNL